ncbi:MAG: M48 family metalloprotease [candidate division NC10 bacterium]|nr:M48 family metalloprotease [candidate division NC10 bacterium]
MQWCATCATGSGGWSRRQFLLALGQASLAAGLLPRAGQAYTIMDEAGDVKIGREADPEILKRFGYYDGPDLQNYIAQIGQRVAATSDTRFSFQFKVVDQAAINAMALPGGFIYLTRGMLAELNDEAQLAGILGHEMTHVNSRHAAKLLTKAFGAQLATLLGVGAAAASGSGAAATGLVMISSHVTNYMLLGYGRDYELEADEVGLRYAHRAGYDPRRMVTFLRALRRTEILRGQSTYHGFEATHPDTALRIAKADTMATLLVAEGGALEAKADNYKAHLDRLRYGEAKNQQRLKVYTVKAGDTLGSIARDEMGDEGRRFELATLNGLRDDAALTPGSRLKLIVKQ